MNRENIKEDNIVFKKVSDDINMGELSTFIKKTLVNKDKIVTIIVENTPNQGDTNNLVDSIMEEVRKQMTTIHYISGELDKYITQEEGLYIFFTTGTPEDFCEHWRKGLLQRNNKQGEA